MGRRHTRRRRINQLATLCAVAYTAHITTDSSENFMTFHLTHPALTTTGKQKFRRKRKFRSAAEAQRFRDYEEYKKENGIQDTKKVKSTKNVATYVPPRSFREEKPKIPSHEMTMNTCTKKETLFYTGDRLIGIAVLHKSCLQPVFSQAEAEEVAKMRRG